MDLKLTDDALRKDPTEVFDLLDKLGEGCAHLDRVISLICLLVNRMRSVEMSMTRNCPNFDHVVILLQIVWFCI
jgi:hypothetical protein